MAIRSDSYKQFVNVNGVSVSDRLGHLIRACGTMNVTGAVEMLATIRILEKALVISTHEANMLARRVAEATA